MQKFKKLKYHYNQGKVDYIGIFLILKISEKCSKPNIIYVGKIQELPDDYFKKRKNSASSTGNFTALEPKNLRSNSTNINYTNRMSSNSLKRDNRFQDNSGQYDDLDRLYVK